MDIRIREIDGETVALCAAKTKPMEGDLYINDSAHHALTTKFGVDWESEGRLVDPPVDEVIKERMLNEEEKY